MIAEVKELKLIALYMYICKDIHYLLICNGSPPQIRHAASS